MQVKLYEPVRLRKLKTFFEHFCEPPESICAVKTQSPIEIPKSPNKTTELGYLKLKSQSQVSPSELLDEPY